MDKELLIKKDLGKNLIIDFDSTFVKVESLEELAKIVLKNSAEKDQISKEIEEVTRLGMEGKIGFDESLERRLNLFKPTKKHIEELIEHISQQITDSVAENSTFFERYSEYIYVVSGGFNDWIVPIVTKYGISPKRVLANKFIYDSNGNIVGYDSKNPAAQKGGKITLVEKLSLLGEIVIIGDGYTDYEVRKAGVASQFVAFTENVVRESVVKNADYVAKNFNIVRNYLKM